MTHSEFPASTKTKMAGEAGIEPATTGLTVLRSAAELLAKNKGSFFAMVICHNTAGFEPCIFLHPGVLPLHYMFTISLLLYAGHNNSCGC